MAIVQNPSTGQYSVVPSPASHYQSPSNSSSSPSSGSSSGGTYYRPGTGGVSTAFPQAGDIPISAPSPSLSSGGGGTYYRPGTGGVSTAFPQAGDIPTPTPTPATTTQQSLRKQELRRYSAAKTFEDKTRIAQEINKEREVAAEQRRIAEERRRILSSGGATTTKTYKDVDTGHKVEHIITKGKGSERIFTTKDLVTGETKVRTYAPPKGGGGARQTGGIYFKPIKPEVEKKVTEKVVYGAIKPTTEQRMTYNALNTEVDRTGQIYDPRTKMYVKSAYVTGGGTAIMTPPTIKETKKIEGAGFIKGAEKFAAWADVQFEKVQKLPIIKDIRESKVVTKIKSFDEKAGTFLEKGRVTEEEQGWLSPSGVKKGFDFAAEQTMRAGEVAGETTKPILIKAGVSEESWLFKPAPIKKSTAKDIISTAYMFTAFAPYMKTGTTQQMESQYVYDYSRGKFVTKKDMMDWLERPIVAGKKVKIVGKGTGDYSTKASRIRELLRVAKTSEQRQAILTTAKESYGESFIRDFATQEGFVSGVPTSISTQTFEGAITGIQPATMEGVGLVGTTVTIPDKLSLFSKTASPVQEAWGKTKQQTMQDTIQKTKQDTKSMQISLLKLKQQTRQDTMQQTKQETKQVSKTLLKSLSALSFAQPQKTVQKTTPILRQPRQIKVPKPIEPKPLPPPPIILPKGGSIIKRLSKKVDEGGFEAIIFKGGEEVSLGIGTKKEVSKKLETGLIKTLSASGYLKEKGTGKKIKAEETGLLLGMSFRKSKVSPFLVVEKKSQRLRKAGTGKRIQAFRKTSGKSKLLSL